MKFEHKHQILMEKTFFYTIYRISLSHNYCVEESVVQVYISPYLFITENDNMT
jgi:hypothetical protein